MDGADGIKSGALQAGGHRFDPGHVHQNFTPLLLAIYAATSASDFDEVFFGAFGATTMFGRSKP